MGNDNTTNNSGLDSPEKQDSNRSSFNRNPEGKGGFRDNPQLINTKGRPPKGWAWSDILEDIGERIEEKSGKQFKQLVGQRLWVECVNGNVMAIKELFNRMEGMPRQTIDLDSKVVSKVTVEILENGKSE